MDGGNRFVEDRENRYMVKLLCEKEKRYIDGENRCAKDKNDEFHNRFVVNRLSVNYFKRKVLFQKRS